jgi:hypothetical protein
LVYLSPTTICCLAVLFRPLAYLPPTTISCLAVLFRPLVYLLPTTNTTAKQLIVVGSK